jgi:hypothetical protein
MMKISFLILINHFLAVKELNNGLNGRLFKLSGNIFTAELIKINFFTSHNYTYLIIEVKFKIGEY